MNELKIFENPEFGTVRTVVIDGEPWFVGKDVCEAFGDTHHTRSLGNIDEEDRKIFPVITTTRGSQNMVVINESGLYTLLFQMQPQKANGVPQNAQRIEERIQRLKRFKHWVTHDVLPTIRKTGEYKVEQTELTPAQIVANALIVAQGIIAEKDKQIEQMTPKAGYFDALVDSKLLTNFRDTAKELGYSQTEFTGWLLAKGYVYKDSKGIIKPYEQYRKQGLFAMKDFQNPNSGFTGTRTLVTVKGKNTFRLLMQVPDDIAE